MSAWVKCSERMPLNNSVCMVLMVSAEKHVDVGGREIIRPNKFERSQSAAESPIRLYPKIVRYWANYCHGLKRFEDADGWLEDPNLIDAEDVEAWAYFSALDEQARNEVGA